MLNPPPPKKRLNSVTKHIKKLIFTSREVEKMFLKKLYNKLTGGGDTGVGS